MLNKETQKKLLNLLKFNATDIDSLVDVKEEKSIDIPDNLLIWTKDEQKAFRDNITKTANENALEIGIKELKKRASLDFEGKDPEKLIEAFKTKVLEEANISVDTKVSELAKDKEKLQKRLEAKESEIEAFKTQFTQTQREMKLKSLLPKEKAEFLTDDQYLTLMKQDYDFVEDNGKQVVKRKQDGTILKDKVENELDWATAIKEHFTSTKGWLAQQQEQNPIKGRGAGSSNTGTPQFIKASEIYNYVAEKHGGNMKSMAAQSEYQLILNQAVSKNSSFDLKG